MVIHSKLIAAKHMNGNEKTILIIDDDLDFQFMICSMLKLNGFAVKSLIEGQIHPSVGLAKTCDMVLLDIELPGTNGVDIGKTLKTLPLTSHIPIILLSGHPECERLFIESKADSFFQKPFSLSQLLIKVNELLHLDDSRQPYISAVDKGFGILREKMP
jgi:DNA-binding response OmpR family regulator